MRILTLCCLAVFLAATFPAHALADFEDTVERSFTVQPGGTLTIESDRGAIEVTTGNADRVAVTVTRKIDSSRQRTIDAVLGNLEMSFEQNGADVAIIAKYDQDLLGFSRPNLQLTFRVIVPETYDLDLRTSGGSIQVADLTGDVECRTAGGAITLQDIDGEVDARTAGGSIRVAGVTGNSLLHTSGGGITVGNAGGTVDTQTSGGSIHIEHAEGTVFARTAGGSIEANEVMGSLDAQTSGGSITAHFSGQPDQNCSLITSGGPIHVYLNPDTRLTINARTSGGGVSTDLPLTVTGQLSRNRINAVLNGGGPELTVRTSGGGISLHREI